jgi:hypothetical protein
METCQFDGKLRIKSTADKLFDGELEVCLGKVWSVAADYPNERQGMGAAGTQTAALIFAGRKGSYCYQQAQKYNGLVWSFAQSIGYSRVMQTIHEMRHSNIVLPRGPPVVIYQQ